MNATDALQEEVLLLTARIAYVIHLVCNAYRGSANMNFIYGGSASENEGDSLLVSWRLHDAKAINCAMFYT